MYNWGDKNGKRKITTAGFELFYGQTFEIDNTMVVSFGTKYLMDLVNMRYDVPRG